MIEVILRNYSVSYSVLRYVVLCQMCHFLFDSETRMCISTYLQFLIVCCLLLLNYVREIYWYLLEYMPGPTKYDSEMKNCNKNEILTEGSSPSRRCYFRVLRSDENMQEIIPKESDPNKYLHKTMEDLVLEHIRGGSKLGFNSPLISLTH